MVFFVSAFLYTAPFQFLLALALVSYALLNCAACKKKNKENENKPDQQPQQQPAKPAAPAKAPEKPAESKPGAPAPGPTPATKPNPDKAPAPAAPKADAGTDKTQQPSEVGNPLDKTQIEEDKTQATNMKAPGAKSKSKSIKQK